MNRPSVFLAAVAAALSSACSMMPGQRSTFSQDALPEPVRVPAGHKVVMETVGAGALTYECREKQAGAGAYEWTFVGPQATLKDRSGRNVGRYYGPPATWESADGSKITGTQLAVAPGGTGNIPLQLVKTNPAMGQGSMSGVTHIQRVATQGGAAPALACDAASIGQRQLASYQADYIFWGMR